MAGPTASVLFSDAQLAKLTWPDIMSDIADGWPEPSLCHVANSCKFGGTYIGEPRPFVGRVYRIDDAVACAASSEEIYAIKNSVGVTFTHCVELGAMCNSPLDHRLLCEIAMFLAKRLNGYVDFNGVVTETPCPGLLTVKWVEDGHDFSTQIGTPIACDMACTRSTRSSVSDLR